MPQQPLDFTICLGDEVDEEELDQTTRRLRDEIAELGVEQVKLAPGGTLPAGAKGEPISIGSLIVSLASAGVFTGLIDLLKSWVHRGDGRTVTVKAKVNGQEVEASYSPDAASPKEMGRFVSTIVDALQRANPKR
jgi:hypothetical protein